jgi:hypothetical protein
MNFPPVWQGAYVKSMKLGDVDVFTGGLRLERHPMFRSQL